MELAGHECVGFCEFDDHAVASYTAMHLLADEQREYLKGIETPLKKSGVPNLKKRQDEISKEEYKNGEWYAKDIRAVEADKLPTADCWCFGFPCQDISIAGKQVGFEGNRSSLFFAVTRLVRNLKEEDRPAILLIENVKNLLSVNGGWDFAKLLIELDEIGYDAEWQVVNSKNFGVPQNRERVFIVGHHRGKRTCEVLPVSGTSTENCICQVGMLENKRRDNPDRFRVYKKTGLSPCLGCMGGGGREPHLLLPVVMNRHEVKRETGVGCCLMARDYKGFGNQDATGVLVCYDTDGEIVEDEALNQGSDKGIVVAINDSEAVYAKWSEEYGCYVAIRKLTPKECFRLQGWSDDYYESAELVNYNSQLYKQAGNGVTVSVIRAIAENFKYIGEDTNVLKKAS